MGRKPLNNDMPLSGRQTEHLLFGWCLGVCDGPDLHYPFESDEHRKELYFKYKEFLFSLEGKKRVEGVFGHIPLPKGKKPESYYDYEKAMKRKRK